MLGRERAQHLEWLRDGPWHFRCAGTSAGYDQTIDAPAAGATAAPAQQYFYCNIPVMD